MSDGREFLKNRLENQGYSYTESSSQTGTRTASGRDFLKNRLMAQGYTPSESVPVPEKKKQKKQNSSFYDDFMAKKNAKKPQLSGQSTTKSSSSALTVKEQLTDMNKNGNVDLLNRPVISAKKLEQAGWGKQGDGTATVYSSSYSNEDGTKTVLVTPILQNGKVLTPNELDKAANDILNSGVDNNKILMGTFTGENSVIEAGAYGQKVHELHEVYYGDKNKGTAAAKLPEMGSNSFENIPIYKEQKKAYKDNTAAEFKAKYGVDMADFKFKDMDKFAERNNLEYGINQQTDEDMPYVKEKGSRKWKVSDDELNDEAYQLLYLAIYNENRGKKANALETGGYEYANSTSFGLLDRNVDLIDSLKKDELGSKLKYVNALPDNKKTNLKPSEQIQINREEHPIASKVGEGVGDLTKLVALSELVGGTIDGIGWLASKPQWVIRAVKDGLTFGIKNGLDSAGRGDDAKTVARNAGIGTVGGAAGGTAAHFTGAALENVLFRYGLQNKVIPEIIRNGAAAANFSLADTASTYFLHPEDERPSAQEIAKNAGVAFAFASITTAVHTSKIKANSKQTLDNLDKNMTASYEEMLRAAVEKDGVNTKKFAQNVIDYTEAMERYLDGKGVEILEDNAASSTVGEYLVEQGKVEPKTNETVLEKARFVGEDSRVRSIKSDLQEIRSRAQDYLTKADAIVVDGKVTDTPLEIEGGSTTNTEPIRTEQVTTPKAEPLQTINREISPQAQKITTELGNEYNVSLVGTGNKIEEAYRAIHDNPHSDKNAMTAWEISSEIGRGIAQGIKADDVEETGDNIAARIFEKLFEDISVDADDIAQAANNEPAAVQTSDNGDFIDDREYAEVGKRNINAFQYDNPEVKPFYKAAANELLSDISSTVKGQKVYISSSNMTNGTPDRVTGQKRLTSESVAKIKDVTGASYDQIKDALTRLINDHGQENIALAKRIELVIDDMLTEGYTDFNGNKIPPNEEYIAVKNNLSAPSTQTAETPTDMTEYRAGLVTENITKGMNTKTGAPSRADNIQSANNRIQSDSSALFDRDFVRAYVKDFLIGMAQRNSSAFNALKQMNGYVGEELIKEVIHGNATPEYKNNNYFRIAAEELKKVLADAAEKNVILHNRTHGESELLNMQFAAIQSGDFSVMGISKIAAPKQPIPQAEEVEIAFSTGEQNGTITQGDVQTMQSISRKSINEFDAADRSKTAAIAQKYYKEMGVKSPFFRAWFGDWRANDTTPAHIVTDQGSTRGKHLNADTGWEIQNSSKVITETRGHKALNNREAVPYLNQLDSIIQNSILLDSSTIDKAKSPNSIMMHSFYALADNGNGVDLIKLYVEEMYNPTTKNTDKRSYQLQNIQKIPMGSNRFSTNDLASSTQRNSYTVSDLFNLVKQYDANFNPSDTSKVVNEDGTPKVVYHGSYSKFTVFGEGNKTSKAPTGTHFFTDDVDVGYSYTGYKKVADLNDANYGGGIYPVYLNIKNPYIVDFKGYVWDSKIPVGMDINEVAQYAKDNGYDGVIAKNIIDAGDMGDKSWDESKPIKRATTYAVFDPTQIKSATDNIGTFDKDNPDIRLATQSDGEHNMLDSASDKEYNENGIESEETTNERNILSNDGSERFDSAGAEKQDERLARGSEKAGAAYEERRSFCEQVKSDGNVRETVKYGIRAKIINSKVYNDEMNSIVQSNRENGIHTIFTTGETEIGFARGSNGQLKTARGVFINDNGKITALIQYDNPDYTPEQINRHERLHKDFHTPRVQKAKNIILNSYSLAQRNSILKKYAEAYDGVIPSTDTNKLYEEYICDVLAGMSDDAISFEPLRNKYWNGDEIADSYSPKDYGKMIDAGGNKVDMAYSVDDSNSERTNSATSFFDLIHQYGYSRIPQGEKPARDVEVPEKISDRQYVSRFARTAMEAGITPDEAVSEFEKAILDGKMTHEVITNDDAMQYAERFIKAKGFQTALNTWDGLIESGQSLNKRTIALGQQLYNQCINSKDVTNAMKIAADLAAEATRSGQNVQAVRMLKMLSPDGKLYYIERCVDKINEEFRNKLKGKYKDIELNEVLMKQFLEADSDEARDEAYDKICQDIADQMPSTGVDKWNAWRYLSMLGNPKTHIRNIIGNAVFYPTVRIKSYMNAGLEKAFVKQENRTTSFTKTKESKTYAAKDFELVKKELQGVNAKYAVTDDIESKRRIFKVGALEFLRKKNGDLLEAEDLWFLKAHYEDAFARVMTARGITAEQLDDDTKESKTLLNKIREIAMKEAQEATYRDANSFADALNKLQRQAERSQSAAVRTASIGIEAVMPFKKTPLNIAKRGIEYSPVGLLSGIYNAATAVRKGKITAAEAINKISKGVVGTGLMMLGYFLAEMGIISVEGDENSKKRDFDGLVGKQNYALNIAGKSYTIDWMAPISMPLFIGVELQKATNEKEWTFAKVVNAMSTISEPLLELSCLSSLQGLIQSVQYSENNTAFAIITELATSYLTQGLPTFGGQFARMIDRKKRNAYYRDKDSQTPIPVQQFIGQVAAKVPFASKMLEPKIDKWGREEDYGELAERMIENSISPGYYSEERYTKVDRELERLNKAVGGNDMFPIGVEKYITIDGVTYNLNVHQYTQFARLRGQKSFELVSDLMNNNIARKKQGQKRATTVYYDNLSDEEKVKEIKKCYDDALDYAKEQIEPMLGIKSK